MEIIHEQLQRMEYIGRLYRKYMNNPCLHANCEDTRNNALLYGEFMFDIAHIMHVLPTVYADIIRSEYLIEKHWKSLANGRCERVDSHLKNMAVKAFFHCLYN